MKKKAMQLVKPINQSTIIQGQINLIKFIESNKFDNKYRKFETFLFDQIL